MDKPKFNIKYRGKIIVERDGEDGFLLMFPNGDVKWACAKDAAETTAKRWFRKFVGLEEMGVGLIEWRI